jgi:hypothetical protein
MLRYELLCAILPTEANEERTESRTTTKQKAQRPKPRRCEVRRQEGRTGDRGSETGAEFREETEMRNDEARALRIAFEETMAAWQRSGDPETQRALSNLAGEYHRAYLAIVRRAAR